MINYKTEYTAGSCQFCDQTLMRPHKDKQLLHHIYAKYPKYNCRILKDRSYGTGQFQTNETYITNTRNITEIFINK